MAEVLKRRGICFVDSAMLIDLVGVDDLPEMSEGRWPVEVFDNWRMPVYLNSLHYKYAIKCDFDFLCLAPYDLADLQGFSETFSAVTFKLDLRREHLDEDAIRAANIDVTYDIAQSTYFNVGFVAVNCADYCVRNVYSEFVEKYVAFSTFDPLITNSEQAVFSFLEGSGLLSVREIDPNYNVRITTLPPVREDGRADIRNLHFLTQNKPWLPVDFRYFDRYVPIGRTSVYLYREYWLRAARADDLFDKYVHVADDELSLLGPMVKVLSAHIAYGHGR